MLAKLTLATLIATLGCRQPPPVTHDPAPAATTAPASGALGCAGLQGCIKDCPPATLAGCVAACVARARPEARPYYDALEACARPACASGDGGRAPCADPSSFSCTMCVMNHCSAVVSACLTH